MILISTEYSSDDNAIELWNKRTGTIVEGAPDAPVYNQKTSRWVKRIDENDGLHWTECEKCGNMPPLDQDKNEWLSRYCPVCGSYMKEDWE